MPELPPIFSIQTWLEIVPQGYLAGTEYGHAAGDAEPDSLVTHPLLREETIRATVQIVVGERCALAASSGLINATPDEASKRFLATQTLDEARHVEIFTPRLFDLGVAPERLAATIKDYANPNLIRFADVLLDKVHKGDFEAGVVGQNIILEGIAFTVFEMLQTMAHGVNPKLVRMLTGVIADERRHVGFGEHTIASLVQRHPEKKPAIERMQEEMSHYMLATFHDEFAGSRTLADMQRVRPAGARHADWHGTDLAALDPATMQSVLAETVLEEFRTRLARIGLEYREPRRP